MKTRKWYKNIIAAVISFAMVIGIFSSMQMEVKAATPYSVDVTDSNSIESAKATTYYPGDTLTLTNIDQYSGYNPDQKSDYYFNVAVYVKADQTSFDSLGLNNNIYNFPTNLEKNIKILHLNYYIFMLIPDLRIVELRWSSCFLTIVTRLLLLLKPVRKLLPPTNVTFSG